jgi:hypothetical protein
MVNQVRREWVMASTVRVQIAFLLVAMAGTVLGGCNSSNGTPVNPATPSTAATPGTAVTPGTAGTPATASSAAPTISGKPVQSAPVGAAYSFRPTVTAPAGAKLNFTVTNLPKWAAFDKATGTISGTPAAADVGSSAQIVLTVADGAATAALAAFAINVTASGVASLSWTAPPANTAGATNLAGYHIYYGPNANSLTHLVDVGNAASTTYVINNLTAGMWYFAVTAYNTAKVESTFSAVVSVTI